MYLKVNCDLLRRSLLVLAILGPECPRLSGEMVNPEAYRSKVL